jgi:hypothetical protein
MANRHADRGPAALVPPPESVATRALPSAAGRPIVNGRARKAVAVSLINETRWRWRLLLARDARTDSARRRLAERARAGDLARVTRGAYLPTSEWASLNEDARFAMRIRSVSATHPGIVLSHAAAAAAWGLPWIGPWPARIDVLCDGRAASTAFLRRHREPSGEIAVIDGMTVTGLARTVVDVARGPSLARAVAVADAALNRRTRSELAIDSASPDLDAELAWIPFRHGEVRARHALDFADGRSG